MIDHSFSIQFLNILLKNLLPLICKSNHFTGLRSSKDGYKRPGGVVGVYRKGHLDVSFLRGSMCAEGMGCEGRWVR